jgi:hypothetical protein
MSALLDRSRGTDPGEVNEGIANDLLAPDRRVGEDFAPDHFNEHGQHQHDVEQEKQPAFAVLVYSLKDR